MTEEKLKYKIEQLSNSDRKLLVIKINDFLKKGLNTTTKNKKIIAYVEVDTPIDEDNLKVYLKSQLPDYMVPSSIIEVEKTPLLPNGKIDKKELLNSKIKNINEEENPVNITKPTSEIEKKLVDIWEEVLNFSPIGIHDNFFKIGGDSILSIQIISKARKAGIELKANQIFENQTIAELSLFSKNKNLEDYDEALIEGEVALTPIQHWFFETHKNAPHFWNQIVEVKNISSTISSENIKIIAEKLALHHDVLRSSFTKDNSIWKSYIINAESIKPFKEINLELLENKNTQDSKIKKSIEAFQQNVNLKNGNLFKILHFKCGKIQQNRTYIIAHHLVIDFVSWNIIFQDIQSALQQISNNQNITFNKKTDSIKKWGSYLNTLINSKRVQPELAFWISQKNHTKEFPVDFKVDSNVYYESSINIHTSIIDEKSTNTLLFKAHDLYNTKIEDLLITTLSKTISEWANMESFCLGLERQGRALDDSKIDISNTVGWFTAFFPIRIKNDDGNIGEKIKSIKEQLNAIPNNGIGYGILKYLSNKNNIKTDLDSNPKIIFNYLGNSNVALDTSKIDFQILQSESRSELSERTYQIEINALVKNGKLQINWSYTTDLYKKSTFLKLVNAYEANLNELINYCNQKEQGEYTPSDFPESGLNQEDLDGLMDLF